jgi:hypothetical protein
MASVNRLPGHVNGARRKSTKLNVVAPPAPAQADDPNPTLAELVAGMRNLLAVESTRPVAEIREARARFDGLLDSALERVSEGRGLAGPGGGPGGRPPASTLKAAVRRMAGMELNHACEAYDNARGIAEEIDSVYDLLADDPEERADAEYRDLEMKATDLSAANAGLDFARRYLVEAVFRCAYATGATSTCLGELTGEPLGLISRDWIVCLRTRVDEDGQTRGDREGLEVSVIKREWLEVVE